VDWQADAAIVNFRKLAQCDTQGYKLKTVAAGETICKSEGGPDDCQTQAFE